MKKTFCTVIFLCIGFIYCSDESTSKKSAVKTAPSKLEFEISSFNSHSVSITYPIVGDVNPDPTIEAYIGLEDQISLSENTENVITVNNFLEKQEVPYDDSITESSQGDVYKFSGLKFLENYKIIVIATNSEGSVYSQTSQRTYYIEDFEDNDFSDWENIDSDTQITDALSANGTNCLVVNNSVIDDELYKEFEKVQPIEISYWVRVTSVDDATAYFDVLDSEFERIVLTYFSSDGFIKLLLPPPDSAIDVMSYTEDTWYHIEIKNIEWSQKIFDLYINNIKRKSNVQFYNSYSSSFSLIEISTLDYNSSWIDDIIVY